MPNRPKSQGNPIHTAVQAWLTSVYSQDTQSTGTWDESLLDHVPKRFTVYEPMALLPSGSFTGLPWATELERHDRETCALLWSLILKELSKAGRGTLSHLAINEGIPLHEKDGGSENILRSPSRLRTLAGEFGPVSTSGDPTTKDFDQAFWVSTKQNGIYQTWAPRWTMFSRGNIKEKARLLSYDRPNRRKPDGTRSSDSWAIDLYAGIGYFVFSYVSLGFRVLCWEINPWSVEGLRRGAQANRWSVKVVQGQYLQLPTEELVAGEEQIVVFLESNEEAAQRIRELQSKGAAEDIRHVNCGFLPTSEPVWEQAWEMTRQSSEAWLHLHENVGVSDRESRRRAIDHEFKVWSAREASGRTPAVEHVESVKTFAPGVWHCVFDVSVTAPKNT